MKQYVVDAFTDEVFKGNQAAVCVMDAWPSEDKMMAITRENNFSETAFTVKEGENYHLRWFTPGGEIDLCGHATLGTAYVLFRFYEPHAQEIVFDTLGGRLSVSREGDLLKMDFPAYDLQEVPVTDAMEEAIGTRPLAAYMGRDLLCVLPKASDVASAEPDLEKVKKLDGLLLHITAPGSAEYPFDCVSRSFAPKLSVSEDPVCGSGHCHIAPYWSKHLGKNDLVAFQASARTGVLHCTVRKDRVTLAGNAALYSVAELFV